MRKFVIPIVLVLLFSLSSCHDTSTYTFRAVVRGQLPDSPVARSVLPQQGFTEPGYYVATMISTVNPSTTYTGATTNLSEGIVLDNIVAGSYTLQVDGYTSESDRTKMMTGSMRADVYYNSSKEFTVSLEAISSGDGYTSTVAIDIDWAGTDKHIDRVDLYVSDSFDSSTLDTWEKVASQEIEFIGSSTKHMSFRQQVPVGLNKFMKFLYYENGQCIGYSIPELAQFYSGQVVTTNDPAAYVYDDVDNPFRLALNITDIDLTYGEDATSVRLYWTNPHVYDKIIIKSWQSDKPQFIDPRIMTKENESQFVDPKTGKMLITFDGLEKETEYSFELYVVHGTGQESEHATKKIVTATLVTAITLKNSLDNEGQKHFSPSMSCTITAEFSPGNATMGEGFSWRSSDPSIATVKVVDATHAEVTAIASGVAEITCTAPIGNVSMSVPLIVSFVRPTELSVVNVEKGFELSWQDSGKDIMGYHIYRSVNGGTFSLHDNVAADIRTYVDTKDVRTGIKYTYQVASFGKIGNVDCESLPAESQSVQVKNPTINIELPKAPSDIKAIFSQYSGTTFFSDETLDIELTAPIQGATRYAWYLNGVLQKEGNYEDVKVVSINKDTKGINLTQIAPMQDLMLVVTINGQQFSNTLRVYMVDKAQIVDVAEIQLDAPDRITYGEPQKINATVLPKDATVKNVSWSSSDDSIASVDRDGTVTIHKTGQVTITAKSMVSDVSQSVSVECYVSVKSVATESPERDYMFVDGLNGYNQIALTAEIVGTNGDEPSDPTVKWESSDPQIASVDERTGVVTAVGAGTVSLTAISIDNPSLYSMVTLTAVDSQLYKNGVAIEADSKVSTTGTVDKGKEYTFSIVYSLPNLESLGFKNKWTFMEDKSNDEWYETGSAGIRLRLLAPLDELSVVLNRQANATSTNLVAKLLAPDGSVVKLTKCKVVP